MRLYTTLCLLVLNLFCIEVKIDPSVPYAKEFSQQWYLRYYGINTAIDLGYDGYFYYVSYYPRTYENNQKILFSKETSPNIKAFPKTFLDNLCWNYLNGYFRKKDYPAETYNVTAHQVSYDANGLVMLFEIYKRGWIFDTLADSYFIKWLIIDDVLYKIEYKVFGNKKLEQKWKDFVVRSNFAIVD